MAASFNTPTFATIIEDGALELVALVDETDIGNVAVGNPVTFTVEAYPAREFTGRVERIAPKGTIISGVVNFEVMISIESPLDELKPDMTSQRVHPHRRAGGPRAAQRSDAEGRHRPLRLAREGRAAAAPGRDGGHPRGRQHRDPPGRGAGRPGAAQSTAGDGLAAGRAP